MGVDKYALCKYMFIIIATIQNNEKFCPECFPEQTQRYRMLTNMDYALKWNSRKKAT